MILKLALVIVFLFGYLVFFISTNSLSSAAVLSRLEEEKFIYKKVFDKVIYIIC